MAQKAMVEKAVWLGLGSSSLLDRTTLHRLLPYQGSAFIYEWQEQALAALNKALGSNIIWRHNGAMKANRKNSPSNTLQRINLRLSSDVLEGIDAECARRAGSISRNTWITEVLMERLTGLASASSTQNDEQIDG